MKITSSALIVLSVVALSIFPSTGRAQDLKPVSVWQPMPDFTLPAFQGGEVTISKLRGKNILLIFPRGLAGENHWCHVCDYQYADLAELENAKGIRQAENLEILFVMPYSREMVQQWVDAFAAQMQDIENWKNPPEASKLDEKGKARMELLRKNFPKKYLYEKGKIPLPFPVLVDADRKVTKGLGVFTTEWSGAKIDQDIPTVMVIDPQGVVQLKYISQNTFDRPTAEYLLHFIGGLGK
jgi:peroxiredoxin